jgi:transposase
LASTGTVVMAAEAASREKIKGQAFHRRKPARRPLPEHLPRERIVYPGPSSCPCCGGALHKLGEDVTETLYIPLGEAATMARVDKSIG